MTRTTEDRTRAPNVNLRQIGRSLVRTDAPGKAQGRTRSRTRICWSVSSRLRPVWPGMSVAARRSGSSAAVNTQATPSSARALVASRRLRRAEAMGARKTLTCSMPGMT